MNLSRRSSNVLLSFVGTVIDSVGLRSTRFRGSCTVPSECTIGCLVDRRITRFQGIERKDRLQNRTTAGTTNKVAIALNKRKPYCSCSTLSPPMFLVHQPSGSKPPIGAAVILKRPPGTRTETRSKLYRKIYVNAFEPRRMLTGRFSLGRSTKEHHHGDHGRSQ
jgi:hypothetical protein